ncbi:hypothetical protein OAV52_02445 [Planktomarina temperata]|jgi:hypothetical protein|nr:hypothetical protein [Planktomarina temperata]
MERKLCGIDLNGIQDYAARNWAKDASGEDKFEDHTNVGSSRSSVVSLKTPIGIEYLGGVQAELAPHGRGDGYGASIGNSENRTLLGDIIKSLEPNIAKLRAAILGVTPASYYAVCSIPDSCSTTEAYQDALITALRRGNFKHPLLVWRSVLSCLALVQAHLATVPCSIGIINHSNAGFDIQTLELKSYKHQSGNILVPERKKIGLKCEHNAGYEKLFGIALGQLKSANTERFLDVKQSKNIAALALGRSVKSELLRVRNGLWKELIPPANLDIPDLNFADGEEQSIARLAKCDFIVFETLTAGRLRSRIHSFLENLIGRDVELLYEDSIAKAALFAADRYAKDIPIYFDYLPQISTIVQTGLEPTNFDLIDQSETLRAGTVYRSKKPAVLGTQAGQKKIEIYLKKEGELHPRQAKIELPVAATSTHSVSVYVEQTPAQGRAAIQINAIDVGLSQTIDFQEAEVLDVTWEKLLENIMVGPVPIPERIIIPADIDNWIDGDEEGLMSLINREVDKEIPNWKRLSGKMDYYAVSSDGDLPEDVDIRAEENLNRLTDLALEQFSQRMSGLIQGNNLPLRFLTWQFKRCPQQVCLGLIEVWEHYGQENFQHPLILNFRSWILVFQGVGRAVFDLDLEKRALFELLKRNVENWHWEAQTACASFLVSRSKTAHKLLDEDMISELLERVKIEFSNNLRTNYREFRYAPFLLAGLLRYREVNPQFLVLGSDPRADEFIEIIERTLSDINKSKSIKFYDRKKFKYWLSEIVKFITCEGGNPKLLIDISKNKGA